VVIRHNGAELENMSTPAEGVLFVLCSSWLLPYHTLAFPAAAAPSTPDGLITTNVAAQMNHLSILMQRE
jgi:hypothetical protein